MKIGFIDSGIGGLSVMKAFITYPVIADYFYIADAAHLPYGLKSHAYIHQRIEKLSQYLIEQHQIDLLVIACNTATAISAKKLRQQYPDIPIIGIEPAIKPAALASKTKEIAILATTSMINNDRLSHLIHEFANTTVVTKIAADDWVTLVEKGNFTTEEAHAIIQKTLQPLHSRNIDQLILGCTHFPFLETELRTLLSKHITIVNPAIAVAKYAIQRLKALNIENNDASLYHYFTTGNLATFTEQLHYLQMPKGTLQTLAV